MAETLTMSTKERQRLQVIGRIQHHDTTVSAAAESLQISERQMYRLLRRHKKDGDQGIIHRLRGKRSNSGYTPVVRNHILKLYQERYSDYGPTLFSEVLSENHHITIDSDTLRRWLKEAKLWNGARPGGGVRRPAAVPGAGARRAHSGGGDAEPARAAAPR